MEKTMLSKAVRKVGTTAAMMVLCVALALSTTPASAQQSGSSFRITPYIWFLGLDGTTAVLGQDSDIEADFGDILDLLNIALMVNMEWNTGQWFFVLDPMWSSLETDFVTPGPLPVSGKVDVDIIIADALVGYVINDNVDVYAGARYYDQDIDVIPGTLPSVSQGDSWTDFTLGLRLHSATSGNWSFTGKIDAAIVGDSESAWYLQAVAMRHFGDNKHLDLGWRYYDVDYESGAGLTRFKWDVAHSGPMLGFSWQF